MQYFEEDDISTNDTFTHSKVFTALEIVTRWYKLKIKSYEGRTSEKLLTPERV